MNLNMVSNRFLILTFLLSIALAKDAGKSLTRETEAEKVSFTLLAPANTIKFDCFEKKVKPEINQVWYGLGPGQYFPKCQVSPNDTLEWIDLTEYVIEQCDKDELPKCTLPNPKLLSDHKIIPNDMKTSYNWLICYSCQVRKFKIMNLTKQVRNDRFQFYPAVPSDKYEDISTKSIDDQRKVFQKFRHQNLHYRTNLAKNFAHRALGSIIIKFRNMPLDEEALTKRSENFLANAEETVGILTNMLRINESITFNVSDVGEIEMLRKHPNTTINDIWHDSKIVTLPNKKPIKHPGGLINSIIKFNSEIC